MASHEEPSAQPLGSLGDDETFDGLPTDTFPAAQPAAAGKSDALTESSVLSLPPLAAIQPQSASHYALEYSTADTTADVITDSSVAASITKTAGSPAQAERDSEPASASLDTEQSFADPGYIDRTLDQSILNDRASESFNDQQHHLRDPLPDVESSFVAPLSPLPTITQDGPDDTYLFDSPKKQRAPRQPASVPQQPASTQAPFQTKEDAGVANEEIPIWPTNSAQQVLQSSEQSDERRRSLNDSTGSTTGLIPRYGTRPRFLRSRNASQRSSASSFLSITDVSGSNNDVDSDVTVGLGADYALQSGGAAPTFGGTRRNESDLLSRTVSMGSVASTVGATDALSVLHTVDDNHEREREELLRTPRPNKSSLAPPTDTVLARRVMDIQVPESLAREYKSRSGLLTPRKPSDSRTEFGNTNTTTATATNTINRSGRNMTLKEQSSTIERLSKENFDLKLKVMFLSDRLDKLSEDGIREMIQENVEFRTNIAILQRDNKALRRRVKELEKNVRDDNDQRPGTSRSTNSPSDFDDNVAEAEREENLYLRERVEEYSTIIEQLRQDVQTKEAEKRRMGDLIRSLQSPTCGVKDGDSLGRQEEEAVWKDLLEQETARREQADEDNRKLRDEIFRLKQDMHCNRPQGDDRTLQHNNNTHSISKKGTPGSSGSTGRYVLDSTVSTASSTTLLEELRREGEQLRHENAELRKEVGAQTSMLTSRNREKERLYQEIEDLKMAQRRGGGPAPSTIDSLLDRSASQVGIHERSGSRASEGMRAETVVANTLEDDEEREELENRNAELRDKLNEAKLENQTLLQELEAAIHQKQETEDIALGVQKDYEGVMTDLMAMQAERDELIAELNDLEQKHITLQGDFEDLRAEAQDAIDGYEEDADLRENDLNKLQSDLADKTENFGALQEEMRKLSEALVVLEDETENKVRHVAQLEQELNDANKELEDLEAKLLESNDKSQRLLVQQENNQGEIAFLREEQESDKINISRLEVSITKAEEQIREEQERVKQLQAQIVTERERSESLATKDKKEMQQVVNELSHEAASHKEEARKLRKSLVSREVEAAEWKERLVELENNLRAVLGDLTGTRSGLLKSIAKLQRELETTVRELQTAKTNLLEKDRLLKQRDALLESHSLEARKVADALDKERTAHRHTKSQFDTFQKTHQHVTRTVSTQDARISELESSKTLDKRRLSQLESTFKDQLVERNNLLLQLWTRLSAICGTDWAHDNSLVSGRALPSLEVVATMLPGFTRNLLAAIKHIETVVGGFPGRVKGVERDLWREYQSLESTLEQRLKKLDRLEGIVRTSGVGSGTLSTPELKSRFNRLEEAYRLLKVENATLRTANEVRTRAHKTTGAGTDGFDPSGSPSPSIPTGPRDRSAKTAAALRAKPGRNGIPRSVTSTSASSHLSLPNATGELALPDERGSISSGAVDPRWILRLRDLENKLKMEREGRTMDRNEAVRRLREQEAELARKNERDKRREGGSE
ncbi:hypothetical protein SEPCBS119000_006451 [Sporothrix epigloea]|uniref:Centrosomin N-terminal motif 1 domain-containing protein n=1 Tax=Sporothrix epigloea TaxID=1892477 RepID=A0ABP0E6D2_9PEZI